MNRIAVLFETPYVRLSVFDHPPGHVHQDPPAEYSSADAISFVEAGAFTARPVGSDDDITWSFAPGMLFVTPRGTAFACEHGEEIPTDRCLSIAYAAETVDALRSAGLPELSLSGTHPTPRQRFLRRRLRALSASPFDAYTELRLDLIGGALFESVVCQRLSTARLRPPMSGGVMRRIARAAELIESDYARPLKLAELAAAADMSPYHFVRSFGSLVGVPPHRYLIAVRLREAVRQILDGANVTGACYAVGFSTPSHFTAAFRQRFGVVPSALLRGRNPALIRALNVGPWGRYVVALRRADPAIAKGA